MQNTDKLTTVTNAIKEAAIMRGASTLKAWTGNKELLGLLTNSEFEVILRRLVELGKIKSAEPTRIIPAGAYAGELPPYDIELNGTKGQLATISKPKLKGTTLIIGSHHFKLGQSDYHYTWQYYIVRMTIRRPGQGVRELDIIESNIGDESAMASKRVIRDAAARLNKKIENATGVSNLFEYSVGVVVYHPEYL